MNTCPYCGAIVTTRFIPLWWEAAAAGAAQPMMVWVNNPPYTAHYPPQPNWSLVSAAGACAGVNNNVYFTVNYGQPPMNEAG